MLVNVVAAAERRGAGAAARPAPRDHRAARGPRLVTAAHRARRAAATLAAVGAQWGDEGKGKIVDWLALRADLVVRFQGGNNAGPHAGRGRREDGVPPGALRHPPARHGEPDRPRRRGRPARAARASSTSSTAKGVLRDPARVRVSGRAHVILDWHIALDKARDEARAEGAIGTTGRGIGPTYEDKVARRGIRVADLLDPAALRRAVDRLAKEKNFELTQLHHWAPIDAEALFEEYVELGRRLEPYVDHTGRILEQALRAGKNVLFEGAQGTFLDIDHGTYPVRDVVELRGGRGVHRAPASGRRGSTACSASPRPTRRASAAAPSRPRTPDRSGEWLGERGAEFGATTGRKRRCGWLDLVVLRDSVDRERLHLPRGQQARRALGPRRDPDRDRLPDRRQAHRGVPDDPRRAGARRARLRGAAGLARGAHRRSASTRRCRATRGATSSASRRSLEVPVDLISVGPGRDETIVRRPLFAPRG